MRASQWLLGLATASTILGAVASGCGGSSTDNGPTDSGSDVTLDVVSEPAVEAAAEASDAPDEACAVDADISTLPVPDASIGDSGKPVSGCVDCVKNACPNLIPKCNASCACKTAFVAFEACVGQGQSLLTCGGALVNAGGLTIADVTCAAACTGPCGVTLPSEGGSEGGEGGGGDGGGDGAAD
ncbi:MAG TPA: hypothetical protein VIF15_02235 [Polyangiaceae bacterium]|jgi:hypothetical protein